MRSKDQHRQEAEYDKEVQGETNSDIENGNRGKREEQVSEEYQSSSQDHELIEEFRE